MPKSDTKKVVDTGDRRAVALDHNTVAGAERALRNKTANLSVTGAAAKLSNVKSPADQVTQEPQASSSTEVSVVVPSGKRK